MNKKYIEPEMEIVGLEDVDIVVASPNGVPPFDFNNSTDGQMSGHAPITGNGTKLPFIQ